MIKAGTFLNPQGAVAMVGPSDLDTDTRFNNVICADVWDHILEKRISALEGGLAAVTVGSGQAASTFAIMNVCQSGDNFISSTDLYGGTVSLFTHTL